MSHALAQTSGTPARTPEAALAALRARLADPMWDGWVADPHVEITDFGHNEFQAHVTLHRDLTEPIKKCPHGLDPHACTTCTPF